MQDNGPQKKPAEYCFAQQRDSSCHMMPFINLQILDSMRRNSNQELELDLSAQSQWHTKRDWLPETFKMTRSWQQAMNALHEKKGAFHAMQQRQLENGLINGHFYFTNGVRVDNTYNPIQNYANMLLYPFNFTDSSTLPQNLAWEHFYAAYKTLPLVCEQGQAMCFDDKTKKYEVLEEVGDNGDWDVALSIIPGSSLDNFASKHLAKSTPVVASTIQESKPKKGFLSWGTSKVVSDTVDIIKENAMGAYESGAQMYDIAFPGNADKDVQGYTQFDLQKNSYHSPETHRYFKLTSSQKELLQLPEQTVLPFYENSILGFEAAYKYRYLPVEAQKNSYFMSSLCQLTFFAMGIDSDHKPITEGHPDFDAYQEFSQMMSQYQENPWTLPSFKKENFLEYHLANMILEDLNLKQQMEETVSILFPAWEKFNEIESLQDENKKPLRDKKKEVMGEAQYLAYCYSQSARFLWAAATSREAFTSVLELNPQLAMLLRLPGTPGPNQVLRNAQQKINGHSFLDVWKKLQAKLVKNPEIPKELASFSAHGIVISVNNDLFEAQLEAGVEHPNIMNQLGFSVVDSYYGEQLSPMYRRENTGPNVQSECDLSALYIEKQQVKRPSKK